MAIKGISAKILKFSALGSPRKSNDIADIGHAGDKEHHALESQPKTGVRYGSKPARIEIPPHFLDRNMHVDHALFQPLESFLALGAADNLPDPGNEDVHGRDGLSIVVLAHIEGLDVLRITGHNDGLPEMAFDEVPLMLGLEIDSPFDLILEFLLLIGRRLQEDIDGLAVSNPFELIMEDKFQFFDQPELAALRLRLLFLFVQQPGRQKIEVFPVVV